MVTGAGCAPRREPVVKISRVVHNDPAEPDERRAIARQSLLFQRALGVAKNNRLPTRSAAAGVLDQSFANVHP
jgi:hypothetical protein